jgi:hypothetical protein
MMDEMKAVRRAVETGITATRLTRDVWRVRSGSVTDQYHKVERNDTGNLLCSCKGFSYRSECVHVVVVKITAEKDPIPNPVRSRKMREDTVWIDE